MPNEHKSISAPIAAVMGSLVAVLCALAALVAVGGAPLIWYTVLIGVGIAAVFVLGIFIGVDRKRVVKGRR